jgi:hypothetical protein
VVSSAEPRHAREQRTDGSRSSRRSSGVRKARNRNLDPVGRRFPRPVRPVRLAPDSGYPSTSTSRTPLSRRPVVGLRAARSNVVGPVRLVFSPGLTTFLDPGGSTSRDPLSRDPGTRSSTVLRSDSARFGWCFPRASRPFSAPKSRFHVPCSRVGRYLVFRRSVSGFGALRSACCPRSLRPFRLPPNSRIPLSRDPLLGLVPLSERGRIGSVGVFPDPLGQFDCRRVRGPRSRVTRYLALPPFAERVRTGCGFPSPYGHFGCRRVRSARFRVPRYLAFAPFVGRSWAASVLRRRVDLDSLSRDARWLHRRRIRLFDGSGRPVCPCRFSRTFRYGTEPHKYFVRETSCRDRLRTTEIYRAPR